MCATRASSVRGQPGLRGVTRPRKPMKPRKPRKHNILITFASEAKKITKHGPNPRGKPLRFRGFSQTRKGPPWFEIAFNSFCFGSELCQNPVSLVSLVSLVWAKPTKASYGHSPFGLAQTRETKKPTKPRSTWFDHFRFPN